MLSSVTVTDPANAPLISEWKLKIFKFRYRWSAEMTECSEVDCKMAWRSLSGVKNDGVVSFAESDDDADNCVCTLTQNIMLPRALYRVMPKARLERFIKSKILTQSLAEFNKIVSGR